MNHSNKVVSAIVAAAVLVTALGVGLVIREVRLRHAGDKSRAGAEPNLSETERRMLPGGGVVQSRLAAEDRAKIKEQRGQVLEKMATMSQEEKKKFMDQMREGFRERQREMGAVGRATTDERAKLMEKWANMSDEEKEALKEKTFREAEARRQKVTEGFPEVSEKQKVESEPNKPAEVQQKTSEGRQNNK